MGKQKSKPRLKHPLPQRRGSRRAVFGLLVSLAVGGGALWGLWAAWEAFGGTPRLVVDRSEVDLGSLPFEAPATVVFTLTNAGDGLLKVVEVPPVKALKGC
ncbi:MAG: hypothetical protein HYY54_07085 [candidate division NC10 bacterium]|nr:hypothetical protein [candidate division NC10 bacterium]